MACVRAICGRCHTAVTRNFAAQRRSIRGLLYGESMSGLGQSLRAKKKQIVYKPALKRLSEGGLVTETSLGLI